MKIGIIREDKFPPDKRVVFTPHTCAKTVKRFPKIEFFVQQSDIRCFSEKEYLEKGISVVDDISNCDILIGVKEVPIEKLNSLVLSSVFLSIGIAYEKDIGPITVNISNEIPTEDLISRLFWLV